jgi:hypothetical protein
MRICSPLRRAAVIGFVVAGIVAGTGHTVPAASTAGSQPGAAGVALAPDKSDGTTEEIKQ